MKLSEVMVQDEVPKRMKLSEVMAQKEDPESDKSFIEKTTDLITGADRATEQTRDFPELEGILGGEDRLQIAKIIPSLMTTLDTDGIVNILTSNFPNVEALYNKDAQGHVYPILRNKNTGALAQVNKPGLSSLDVLQGLGLATAFTPAGRAGLSSVSSVAAAAKVGAASAVTQGGLNAVQQASGRNASASDIAQEIGFAGAGGAIFESIFRALGPLAKNIYSRVKGGQIDDTSREIFVEQATKLGVDPADITDDFIRKAANDAAEAFDPKALSALEDEFKVTLTNAQRSGNQAALSAEDAIRSGARGSKAQEVFLKNEAGQVADIGKAAGNLQDDLARGSEVISNRQQAGSMLAEGVRNAERTASGIKNQAYGEVGEAAIGAQDFKGVLRDMRRSIRGVEFDRSLPQTAKTLNDSKGLLRMIDGLKEGIKPFHIKQVENYRKRLNTAIGSAEKGSPDMRQLMIMKNQFDDSIDSAVKNGLFAGDESSLEALKTARRTNYEYAKAFRNKDSKIIQQIVESNPTDEQVINSLFSASSFNKQGAANLAKTYKEILGADSDAWNAVRQSAFKQLIKTGPDGAISGAKSVTSITKALEQNRSLMNELFSTQEMAKIRRFAALVKRSQPELVRSRENPSGTAQKLVKEAERLLPFIDGGLVTVSAGGWKVAKSRVASNQAQGAFRPFNGLQKGVLESALEGAAIGQSERVGEEVLLRGGNL